MRMRKILCLPDGSPLLEKSFSNFWREAEIPFPWSLCLSLAVVTLHQKGRKRFAENREHWMRERHGEAAETLRAATRAALSSCHEAGL